jgi:hypothetical protein
VLGQATGNTDSVDSPRPELGGSHHLPPCSILCVTPLHPHPNDFLFPGLPRRSPETVSVWTPVTLGTHNSRFRPRIGMRSEANLLSNGVSHSICTHQDRVNSPLFVLESQTASLTPGPSFDHNLYCRCPNGSCKVIFDIYTSNPFQRYEEHLKARCFDFYNRALKLQESQRTPSSCFWECESHPHTCLKVELPQIATDNVL